MTMTFSNSISNQLDFDHALDFGAITQSQQQQQQQQQQLPTSRSRSKSSKWRSGGTSNMLNDKQVTLSIMKSRQNNLLASTISKLLGKYATSNGKQLELDEAEDEEYHDAISDIPLASQQIDCDLQVPERTSTTISSSAAKIVLEDAINQSAPAAATINTSGNSKKPNCARSWQLECKYTLSEVQQHNSLDDCWMVIFDKVYNITEFVYEHPGGDFILFEYAGRDATHPFLSSRHGSSAYKMLDKYWIGILVDEELYYSNNSSYCSVYLDLSWRSTPTLEEANETSVDSSNATSVSPSPSSSQASSSSNLSE